MSGPFARIPPASTAVFPLTEDEPFIVIGGPPVAIPPPAFAELPLTEEDPRIVRPGPVKR